MRRISLLGLLAGICLLPGAASAQTIAPPGNSAIDEYVETVPSAAGNRPSTQLGESGSQGGGGGGLTVEQHRALAAQGADGRAAIEQIERAGGSTAGAPGGAATGRESVPPPAAPPGDSPVRAVIEAATGGGDTSGMGPVLPMLLLGSLAAFAAIALRRRRTS